MTSTSVAGGVPISPLQASLPPQSPVSQAGCCWFGPKLQPVLAQNRPVHDDGAMTRCVWPEGRVNPPSAIMGWPAFGAVAGHTVNGHLFRK